MVDVGQTIVLLLTCATDESETTKDNKDNVPQVHMTQAGRENNLCVDFTM